MSHYLVKNNADQHLTVHGDKGIPPGNVHVKNEAQMNQYKESWGDQLTIEEYDPDLSTGEQVAEMVDEDEVTGKEELEIDPADYTGDEYNDLIQSVVNGELDGHLEELSLLEEEGRDRAMLQEAIEDRQSELS